MERRVLRETSVELLEMMYRSFFLLSLFFSFPFFFLDERDIDIIRCTFTIVGLLRG